MFLITEEGRQRQAAEVEKRRKERTRAEQTGASPANAAAEGAAEYNEQQQADAEKAFGGSRPYLADGHARNAIGNPPTPAQVAHDIGARIGYDTAARGTVQHGVRVLQVGQPAAPNPRQQATLHTAQAPMVSGSAYTPGTATVQHVAASGPLAGFRATPSAVPAQPGPHTAPSGAQPPAPRGGGNAAPNYSPRS